MQRRRLTRERSAIVVLSAILSISLVYYGVVALAHRQPRFAAPLFTMKRSTPNDVHVSTLICHGANRYWAVRLEDETVGHDRTPR
jgi:hypothetical protein